MAAQPTGTVTMLFTDIEGSTRLLEWLGSDRYAEALDLHRRLLRETFERHGGYEVDCEGDAFFVTFARAVEAVAAACEGQRALAAAGWPEGGEIRVRMGLHTGEPVAAPPKYVGIDVHRAARIMAAAHGGQVLVSETTAALLDGVPLHDVGAHRLKDLLAPIRLRQLEIEGLPAEFPPLRSLRRSNLPAAAWPLLGRWRELGEIRGLIGSGARVVTLTGSGGSGKTRLALQAAAELSDEFPDGVFFVALAPLRERFEVGGAVAETLGLQPDDDVIGWLESKRLLIVLDNLEHLQGVEEVVAGLLVGEIVVLATSRAPLHLSTEHELPVDPLADDAAVELFVTRAAAHGRAIEPDQSVVAVCRRLDNLSLALELAAARAKLFAPEALLQRLDAALPLLTGGAVDLPDRQRTLRATIEWSFDLLDRDGQAAFRRMSVFRGSFTLAAAEAVTGATLEEITALVDQSMLKPFGDDRFFLLETLREYARERLGDAGEADDYALRHARWYLAQLEAIEPVLRGPRTGEFLAWYGSEDDNLRAMLDRLGDHAPAEATRAAELLCPYWIARGGLAEGRGRLQTLLASELPTAERATLLVRLADLEERLGHLEAAESAAREAIPLAEASGDRLRLRAAFIQLAWVAYDRDSGDEAVQLAERALDYSGDDPRLRAGALGDLGVFLKGAGRTDDARATLREAADAFSTLGDAVNEATVLANLAGHDLDRGEFESARVACELALARANELGHYQLATEAGLGLGYALLGLGRRAESRAAFITALDHALAADSTHDAYRALTGIALAADPPDHATAARIRGAVSDQRRRNGTPETPVYKQRERRFEQPLIATLGEEAWSQQHAAGTKLTLDQTIELARLLADQAATTPP